MEDIADNTAVSAYYHKSNKCFTHFLSDCYSKFQPLLRILDYLKANESVKIIALEGVVNNFRLGVTTGQAAKAAKDFNKMLTTGQIS